MFDFCTELAQFRTVDKARISKALTKIETSWSESRTRAFLDRAFELERAHVVGITGPPGVGKSTLISALAQIYRGQNLSVGIIAVDPSSQISGGALLGDRARFDLNPDDEGVFVRSMASRDRLGGLSEFTYPSVVLLQAIFDRVIVETVGIGQSEVDISSVADSVVLCIQPASGDGLQYIKAGAIEIPDIAVVTKTDLGMVAERALHDVRSSLSLTKPLGGDWDVPVIGTSVVRVEGIGELSQSISDHYASLGARNIIVSSRMRKSQDWLRSSLRERFGRRGIEVIETKFDLAEFCDKPFQSEYSIMKKFDFRFK